jgi:regulator of sigma E protease
MELLQTILILIVTLGILVSIHEYGHFWVARRCGIKVLRFSVGFGKPLLRWTDKHGTEFVVAGIPLGGYVKMLDEREGPVPTDQQQFAFNRKPVTQRIATVAAGPLANFLLAILIYWLIFLSGVSGVVPIIDSVTPGSIAEIAGLEPGQEIVAVDGEATPTREAVHLRLLNRLGESGEIIFSAKYPGSELVYESSAELDRWLAGEETTNLVGGLGISLYQPPITPVVDVVVEDTPADAAGLEPGDTIVATGGIEFNDWFKWSSYVRDHAETPLSLYYLRDGIRYQTEITPALVTNEEGESYGQIGVQLRFDPEWPNWPESMQRSFSYSMGGAAIAAVNKTWEMSYFTLDAIGKMLEGLISPKNLSGPITIAKVASASAQSGLEHYLGFLALLSVSLGVLNLLPIPVLDGGHILYYLIELLSGREVPERVQVWGYKFGLVIILGLMTFAIYNDISRL